MSNTFMKATEFQVRWTRRNSNILKRMETERSVYNSQWREDIFLTCLHAVFIYYGNKITLGSSSSWRVVMRCVFSRLCCCAMSSSTCFRVFVFARCRESPVSPSAFLCDVGREAFSRPRFFAMSGESCYLRLPLIKNDILHHIKFFSEYGIL